MTCSFSLPKYLEELAPLVNTDCGSDNPEGINKVAEFLAKHYLEMGWHVRKVDLGPEAGMGLEVRNKPESNTIDVMLLGHMDTVFPEGTALERPLTWDDKRAYGPGVSDMKSGLLSVIYALRSMDKETLDKMSVCICMNPDEEIGSPYSTEWILSLARKAKQVLVAEAARADGSLVKARKGLASYKATFSCRASHAGNAPLEGRSASCTELARWIHAINEVHDQP